MPPDRVIQDSDDEDDATSIDPLQDQSSVRRSSLAESNAGTVNGEQRYDAELEQLLPAQSGSPFSKINFDVFLQSPSQERGAQELSSSQQREERWIPAEIGSESVGAMMSEISRAQRQLVDDNFTYDDLQLPPTGENTNSAPSGSPLAKSNKRSQTMSEPNDRGIDGEECSGSRIKRSRTSLSCQSGEVPEPTILLQEASHGAEGVRNYSEYAETTNVLLNDGSTHHVHGDTFATSHDGTAANTSYNFFESSIKDNTEMSTIPIPSPARDSSGKQSNAPRQTPGRSKSMQILLDSPHDTEPSSSLISPHVKRTKSELPARDILQQSEKSACDELSLPAAIEVPVEKKKRGRKKKQVAPEETTGDEPDELIADGPASASLQTQPTKRGRGRPRKSEVNTGHSEGSEPTVSNSHNDDAAAGAQTDQTAPVPAESNDVSADKKSNSLVPQETERSELDPSPDSEEMDIELPKEQYIPRPSRSRAQPVEEGMPSESMENPQKESKKKKLKRGKTTSVILKKSYESDVEDDVIWVDEKPDNVVFKDEVNTSAAVKVEVPDTKESGSKNVEAVETKPSMTEAAEQKKNATLTDPAAPSQVEEPAPGPKKRGRKRKKTAEPANTDQPAEGDPQQLQNKEETSQSKDTSTVLQDVSTNASLKATNDNQTTNDQDLKADTANEDEDKYPNSPKKPDQNTALETPKKQKEVSEDDLSTPKDATSTSKGPTKHSPISTTSKVPFRVGLSRKARIAPLLKVVRK